MMDTIAKIDWNFASELGLVERINREVLHPLGLAMCRDVEAGISPCLLVADDGVWEYAPEMTKGPVYSQAEIQRKILTRTMALDACVEDDGGAK